MPETFTTEPQPQQTHHPEIVDNSLNADPFADPGPTTETADPSSLESLKEAQERLEQRLHRLGKIAVAGAEGIALATLSGNLRQNSSESLSPLETKEPEDFDKKQYSESELKAAFGNVRETFKDEDLDPARALSIEMAAVQKKMISRILARVLQTKVPEGGLLSVNDVLDDYDMELEMGYEFPKHPHSVHLVLWNVRKLLTEELKRIYKGKLSE